MSHSLFVGDCLDVLKTFEDNSIDGCITDPPYGMGMDTWDHSVPTVEIWEEVLRVLKPGSFCLSFCSAQLYHRMACAVDDAGFNIKDQIMWMVTTKMPKKNHLKPAHEPIVVAQKPFRGSIQKNFEEWGVGKVDVLNTRVPWEGKPPTGWIKGGDKRRSFGKKVNSAARERNACEAMKALGKEKFENILPILMRHIDDIIFPWPEYVEERLVIKESLKLSKKEGKPIFEMFQLMLENRTENANPAGRYPSNIIGEVLSEHQKYFYAPRVTRKERGEYNDHPTPKPISLMAYLIKLYCPEGGVVLDPFCGSGSTGIAALLNNRTFLGIDLSEHYIEISEKRIKESQKTLDND